ncbi:ankyrin repeat domain-containing protein, partial [Klebsiella pneumoniae]|nr:ankyrin repeat domain-containing protein [Klebsiella pneumoniae]
GMVCVVGRMRDLILQLSKSSIYSTKPIFCLNACCACNHSGE